MKIYGDLNSGNCLKVKWVCDKVGRRYDWVDIDTMKGQTHTPDFLKLNGAGQVPVIGISGRTEAGDEGAARAAGMDFFFSKPVSPGKLADALAELD